FSVNLTSRAKSSSLTSLFIIATRYLSRYPSRHARSQAGACTGGCAMALNESPPNTAAVNTALRIVVLADGKRRRSITLGNWLRKKAHQALPRARLPGATAAHRPRQYGAPLTDEARSESARA